MRRKTVKILASLAVAAILLPSAAYAETATISANYVNFREAPGMNAKIIDCLSRGTVINVTDKSVSGWYAVSYNGQNGYMSSDYVSILGGNVVVSAAAPTPSSTPVQTETAVPEETTPALPNPETETPSGNVGTALSSETGMQPSVSDVIPVNKPEDVPGNIGTGKIGGDYVRFRTGPGTNYTIITSYNRGKELAVLDTMGEWTKCSIDGREGFVFSQYVLVNNSSSSQPQKSEEKPAEESSPEVQISETKNGFICGNNVRFRKGPSLNDPIIKEFYYSNPVTITGYTGEWTAVTADGQSGFVFSQYVKEGSFQPAGKENVAPESTVTGSDIVNCAMQYLGYSYKYGGQDPSTGFDCSGLIWYVYKNFGIDINRVAADQAKNGSAVSGDLQPGDILCFYTSGSIGHSGIYIGDGKFIHSANESTGVIITELSGYYTNRGYEARRIIE